MAMKYVFPIWIQLLHFKPKRPSRYNLLKSATSDGNSSDTTNQGGEMERNYKMMALQQG
jgi:hypothetical protein